MPVGLFRDSGYDHDNVSRTSRTAVRIARGPASGGRLEAMDHPVHAAEMIDKGEGVPKIVAAIAGLALLGIAAGAMIYSGYWSPPATTAATQPAHK